MGGNLSRVNITQVLVLDGHSICQHCGIGISRDRTGEDQAFTDQHVPLNPWFPVPAVNVWPREGLVDPRLDVCFQRIDPVRDIELINTELALADMETVEKTMHRESKKAKSGDKDAIALMAVLDKVLPCLNEAKAVRTLGLDDDELQILKPLCLITVKPVMYLANVDETGFENNPLLQKVLDLGVKEHAPVVAICAKIESEISELEDEDKSLFLAELGLTEPGLDRVIRAAYDLLGLQTYFTAGVQEVRAWTVKKGATAPQAAGVIHTDFERGFIRAEVIAYAEFVKNKGEQGAKEAGKMRLEGKEYIVQDGDVMHFRFNV